MACQLSLHRPLGPPPRRSSLGAASRPRPLIKPGRPPIAVPRAFSEGFRFSPFGERPKGVFQHPSLKNALDNVELVDARDAHEACTGLSGEAKEACYLLFGCEAAGVEKYLDVVEGLEASFQASEPDPLENCWRFKS